jgi:hypothetical protein
MRRINTEYEAPSLALLALNALRGLICPALWLAALAALAGARSIESEISVSLNE